MYGLADNLVGKRRNCLMKDDSSCIITSVFLLTLGACLYLLFRKPVIFTEPLTQYGLTFPLIPLASGFWSDFLRFTLPDVLWVLAILTFSSTIKLSVLRILALLVAPFYEVGQLLGLIPGTFDYIDLIVYIIITLIFIKKWEKNSQRFGKA